MCSNRRTWFCDLKENLIIAHYEHIIIWTLNTIIDSFVVIMYHDLTDTSDTIIYCDIVRFSSLINILTIVLRINTVLSWRKYIDNRKHQFLHTYFERTFDTYIHTFNNVYSTILLAQTVHVSNKIEIEIL